MSRRPVIDAGPALNFFASNQERLLIQTLGPLSAPETVRNEVFSKAREERFARARVAWERLGCKYLNVLSDDWTPELEHAVQLMTGMSLDKRRGRSKDLGETMVVAHAVVLAENGESVIVLIDDQWGAMMASKQIYRLARLREQGRSTGTIQLLNTQMVLKHAIRKGLISDKGDLRARYGRLRELDDGLVSVEQTELLSRALWQDRT